MGILTNLVIGAILMLWLGAMCYIRSEIEVMYADDEEE